MKRFAAVLPAVMAAAALLLSIAAQAAAAVGYLPDVTEEMTQQEKKMEMRMQAVDIANDVAKKQLKIVQDIASLLGETAADTLIAIERLKETISDE